MTDLARLPGTWTRRTVETSRMFLAQLGLPHHFADVDKAVVLWDNGPFPPGFIR